MNTQFDHPFRKAAGHILESGQSNTLVVSGNVHDLFYLPPEYAGEANGSFVQLTAYLRNRWGRKNMAEKNAGVMLLIYGLNGSIRFMDKEDETRMRDAWVKYQSGANQFDFESLIHQDKDAKETKSKDEFRDYLDRAVGRPSVALQVLRQFCRVSRESKKSDPLGHTRLIILLEWADMILPEGVIAQMQEPDRHRIGICQDWFSDPEFVRGRDAVMLITESASLLNHRLTRLPQVAKVDIPAPNTDLRQHFIDWFDEVSGEDPLLLWDTKESLAAFSAGLTLQALHQLLKGASHENRQVTLEDVIERIKAYIESQLGEGVVEFKQPKHRLSDVIGNRKLKAFLQKELILRIRAVDESAVTGIGVPGPIGGGKSYCFEALAAELSMPVMVLVNIRSQWFGQTDVMMDRLARILYSLQKGMIFVDEADTAFGGVEEGTHETEKRLTGRMQGFMSDPKLRGKIVFLLITARYNNLSADMRREERLSVVTPVFDPDGEDRHDFIHWMLSIAMDPVPTRDSDAYKQVEKATEGFSAASFKSLRSDLKALKIRQTNVAPEDVMEVIKNNLPRNIGKQRRLQTLVALTNCSRLDLLPSPETYEKDLPEWHKEILQLRAEGIR